jgi:hypothetical protein
MRKLIASGTVLAILASPAFAAKQYWIVQQSTNSCTVVDEKPKSTVTIVGDNKGYGSRAEAERSIKTTKGCTQE